MEITLNNETYSLNLGYRFSLALDKVYTIKQDIGSGQNVEFGVGVQFLHSYLSMGNFDAVVKFYTCGLNHLKQRPSDDTIIEYIEERAADIGIDALADECIQGLQDAGFYKQLFATIEETKKQKK